MTWTVAIEQDEDGSLVVPIPDELLEQLDVGIGDSLYLLEELVGTERCLVLSKKPQTPKRIDALVENCYNEKSGTRESDRLDQLTRDALADVDAGRVLDHRTIQTWADGLDQSQSQSQCGLSVEALHPPRNEADYDRLVKVLDGLLVVIGDEERHPLAGLASRIVDWMEAYDEAHPRLRE
ncbi:hypothetical protein [Marinobacter sp.]|uniref:hypothetical protein n=1 Tax=Marinobacter sp. TaxID=50741 RepID=UPI003A95412E